MSKLKTKVDDLDVANLKPVSIDSKKLSDGVSREVIKNTKFSRLNTWINNLENNIPYAFTLIKTNQYNADKQSLEKNWEMLRIRYVTLWFSDYSSS